jgi:hypothetical protein
MGSAPMQAPNTVEHAESRVSWEGSQKPSVRTMRRDRFPTYASA